MHGKELINEIRNKVNSNNLRKIYSELEYIQNDIEKLEKSIEIVCELINLVGHFLVLGESQKNIEGWNIFDAFVELDFMSEFTKLSSYENYKINLEIINTFSFLMINIKDKTSLYYLFSGNCLNKIISKDHNQYDEEYISYYINFLKSLSLRLDETIIQLFYLENSHSFPLIENALEFYNHEDSMVRSVVRNIVLNVLKIKNPKIQNYFGKLPSIGYFSDLICHLRDICYKLNEGISNNNTNNIMYSFDDLVDETLFIDDLLNLNLTKINYILINNFFYYLILPVICGALCSNTDKISKNLSIFLLIFLFCNIKNEVFKNSLFSLLFFDKMSADLKYFLVKIPEKINYSFKSNLENGKSKSFSQFISENYSQEFFVNLSKENNIYYLKHNRKYNQLNDIFKKTKKISKKLGKNKSEDINIKAQIEKICMSFLNEKDLEEMYKYHKNLCISSGLNVGKYLIEEKGDFYNRCFMSFMNQLFNQAISNDNFYSSQDFKKNKIKKGLFSLLDKRDEMTILLINILIFVVQSKEINLSKELLRYAGLENIQEKILVRGTIGFDYSKDGNIINKTDIFEIKNFNSSLKKVQTFFDKNNFNFNNDYFKVNKIKTTNLNDCNLVEKLSSIFLNNKDLLPLTFQLICFNINNICLGWNNNIYITPKEEIINNVEAKYKLILYSICFLINDNKKREKGYNCFKNQWSLYKDMNNNKIFELIKNSIISSCYILISKNNNIEECPEIIKYNKVYNEDENFNNYLIMFMILHDIKELLYNSYQEKNDKMYKDLIKNHFPLDYSQLDFKIKVEYDIGEINEKDIYKQTVDFSFMNEERYQRQELIIYREYIYFCTKVKRNIVQINQKYALKYAILLENEENIIECIIINRENQEKIEIKIKFKNENIRNEALDFINNKIDIAKKNDNAKFYKYIKKLLKHESIRKTSSRCKIEK